MLFTILGEATVGGVPTCYGLSPDTHLFWPNIDANPNSPNLVLNRALLGINLDVSIRVVDQPGNIVSQDGSESNDGSGSEDNSEIQDI